jgi:imidazolonepropionase-like amidohydrolase
MAGSTMRRFGVPAAALAALIAAAVAGLLPAAPATGGGGAVAVIGARVFDGERVLPRATVVFEGGMITAVGEEVVPPAGAEVIDGAGKTLLPGLIDAHTHCWGDALERALQFGVTTTIDMFTDQAWAAARRGEQAAGGAAGRADLVSAGTLVTAPGGHGTEYGLPIPTIEGPEEAQEFVDARLAEGSDFIKLVYDDGAAFRLEFPSISRETMAAVIAAAHRREALAVVHVSTLEAAREALAAGADGLVHVFNDRPPDDAFVELAARSGAFVVPTLTVVESTTGRPSGAALLEDDRLAKYLTPAERGALERSFPVPPGSTIDHAKAAVRALKAAGVPLLAGTDAPNPGTSYGVSIHRELELLVEAGLTPAEALTAATAAPARAFGLDDRGTIAPGRRADLLLVKGDPTADVRATRAIDRLWKGGREVERRPAEATPGGPARAAGPVSDFDDGTMTAAYGAGWQSTTDQMMAGKSEVELEVVEGGAGGSSHALEVRGTIRPGFAFPWAGVMFFPADVPMQPVNLSAAKELVFQVRASSGPVRVMAFASSLGPVPAQQTVAAGPEWTEVAVPLSAFGIDGSDLTAVAWSGGPAEGEFSFRIDSVSFR